jgi:hypothetical protein
LDFNFPLWKSTEIEGWWLSASDWSERRRSSLVTLAARRSDVARDPVDGETRESNWYLTQRVSTDQDAFAARHALTALMGLYADRLGGFRDAAGKKRRLRRPVRDGKELNDYLVGDGLDVATVTSDLRAFTKDLNIFRWGVPEFTEYRQHLPDGVRDRPPIEYLPALRDTIRRQAKRLAADTRITTENVRASAELRQSISNTRLQRLTLALSVAAALVAVISLLVANH